MWIEPGIVLVNYAVTFHGVAEQLQKPHFFSAAEERYCSGCIRIGICSRSWFVTLAGCYRRHLVLTIALQQSEIE
jgi:hypothetical protein